MTDAKRVAEARRWYREQGYAPVRDGGVTLIVTPAYPDTWDANWASAEPGASGEALIAALDRHMTHSRWRVAITDALTDPEAEAALALAGFRTESVLIEMTATAVTPTRPTQPVSLEPVTEANWATFAALVDADMREGKRTGEHDERVAAGLLDGMRRRLGACDYQLLVEGGDPVGYGMTAGCPNGLGLIENLFTLPQHRGRGLMSGFIADAADRLLAAGCDAVFLDAHAHDTPKRLYAALGFRPVALSRTWVSGPHPLPSAGGVPPRDRVESAADR